MNPGRVSAKFFSHDDSGTGLDLTPFIALFHEFIRTQAVPGLLVDVVDYAHVPEGPGVVLIGHDVDYGIDLEDGRPGLKVTRKRCRELPLVESLRDTLSRALQAIREIEREPEAKLGFPLDSLELAFPDRLAVPNRAETSGPITREIAPVLVDLLGGANYELTQTHADQAPRPFCLTLAAEAPVDLEAALARLGGARIETPAAPRQSDWDVEVDALQALRDEDTPHTLLDVREPHEYEICNLGGQLVPLGSLSGRLSELHRDAKIIVHCRTGGRSAKAVAILRDAGFRDAWNLRGGILVWIDRIDSSLAKY